MHFLGCRFKVEQKVYLVNFPNDLFPRFGTVDNSQTVRIKEKHPQSAQEGCKRNISNWRFLS